LGGGEVAREEEEQEEAERGLHCVVSE
jgi:hypothetical protein